MILKVVIRQQLPDFCIGESKLFVVFGVHDGIHVEIVEPRENSLDTKAIPLYRVPMFSIGFQKRFNNFDKLFSQNTRTTGFVLENNIFFNVSIIPGYFNVISYKLKKTSARMAPEDATCHL